MPERDIATELRARREALIKERDSVTKRIDAITIVIQELEAGPESSPTATTKSPRSTRRPTIRELAISWAEDHQGVVLIREFLQETKRYGFKSDHGGLHTSLKEMTEFRHSGPGEFTLEVAVS